MASKIVDPAFIIGSTSYQTIGVAVPALKARRYDLRAANVYTQDTFATVLLTNGTASGEQAFNYPLPVSNQDGAVDLERGKEVPAGWYFQVKCSHNGDVVFTLTGVEDDA